MNIFRRQSSISTSLLLSMLGIILLISAAIIVSTNILARRGYAQRALEDLDSLSRAYQGHILEFLESNGKRVVDFSSDGLIRNLASEIMEGKEDAVLSLASHLAKNKQSLDSTIVGINILDRSSRVLSSTDPGEIGKNYSGTTLLSKLESQPYGTYDIGDIETTGSFHSSVPLFITAAPLMDTAGRRLLGVIANYIRLDQLNALISGERHETVGATNTPGFNARFDIYLVNQDGLMITPSIYVDPSAILNETVDTEAVRACKSGNATSGLYDNYRGIPVAGSSRCLPHGWTLIVEMEQSDVFASFVHAQRWSAAIALVLTLLAFWPLYLLLRRITSPLEEFASTAQAIARGNIELSAREDAPGEIGSLARSFNAMVKKLQETQQSIAFRVADRTKELQNALAGQKTTTKAMLNLMEDLEDAKKRIELESANALKFKLSVDASITPINIFSKERRFIYVNRAWERLTGYTFAEVEGREPSFLDLSRSDPKALEELGVALKNGQPFHSEELVGRNKNGVLQDIDLTLFPVMKNGTLVNIVGISQDITNRKRSEKAKSEFVSLASHQLRTPLTAIRWIVSTLKSGKTGPLTPMQEDMINDAEKSVLHMGETIGTMLTISRIDADVLKLSAEEFNPHDVLAEIVAEQKPFSDQKKQRVSVDCTEKCSIISDRKIFKEVISNLIGNAVKYTPDGGIISCKGRKDDDSIVFEVTDTGYGIPLNEQSRVFSKFFRAENVTAKQTEGTGLGLYLVHSLIGLLGGTISFVSEENKGTTFTVTLPITPSTHAPHPDR